MVTLMALLGIALVLHAQQTQLPIYVPAVNVSITALSANGMPLAKYAIVSLSCAGYNVSNIGSVSTVIPIPSTGSITCRAYAYSFGMYSNKTVVLTAGENGETVSVTLVIPVSGYYMPGIGFVPVGTLIVITIVIIIIIILIIIGLIEYARWRRERLARLIRPLSRINTWLLRMICGIILSGGSSRRFQASGEPWVDKALYRVNNEPMIRLVYNALSQVTDGIIIAVNNMDRALSYKPIIPGADYVIDDERLTGPLAYLLGAKQV